jgi:ATP-binding cassette, subfamily B (MDR/TAP), member 1
VIAFLASIGEGMVYPFFAMYLGKLVALLTTVKTNPASLTAANFAALMIIVFALFQLICPTIHKAVFGYVGSCLTQRLRKKIFLKMLRMPVAWFDIAKNNSGALSTRLSSDCNSVNSLVTVFIAVLLQISSLLITGLIISFTFEWRTAIVGTLFLPFLIFVGILQIAYHAGFSANNDEAYALSTNIISEVTGNPRTVASFDC